MESLEPDLARLLADLQVPPKIYCRQDLFLIFAQGCDGDRLVPLLQEVQSLSNPRPSILGHFTEELTIHMASNNNQVTRVLDTSWLPFLGSFPGDLFFLIPVLARCAPSPTPCS